MSIWTILFVVLLIAWIGGFTMFHVAGGLIHLLACARGDFSSSAFRNGQTNSLGLPPFPFREEVDKGG